MNRILFFLVTLFILAAVGCSTSRTYYTEYDTTDISYVVDSIVSSGTVMGQWKEWRFTLDDGRLITLVSLPYTMPRERLGGLYR